jgi:hypothetical protein
VLLSAHQRWQTAQWALARAHASTLDGTGGKRTEFGRSGRYKATVLLVIDSEFAQAMLTVGLLAFQHGPIKEALRLFLEITKLSADTEDQLEIIDEVGDFLIDQSDLVNAE